MFLRIDQNSNGPRLCLGGLRSHHGLTGEMLAFDGLRRRSLKGLIEAAAGVVLVGDDWRDFPFGLRER